MRNFRSTLLWYLMLNKRMLKKYSYILILLLIPILVLVMSAASKEDSAVLTVAVVIEGEYDSAAQTAKETLEADAGIVSYRFCNSEEEARDLVVEGTVNAAWILPGELQVKMAEFVEGKRAVPVVTVYEQIQGDVSLQLSHEKLYAILYPALAYACYENYIVGETVPEEINREMLKQYYEEHLISSQLIEVSVHNSTQNVADIRYLETPLRGLLALVLLLTGLAAAMYFMQDVAAGTFAWLPSSGRFRMACLYPVAAISSTTVMLFLALSLTDLFSGLGIEVASLMLYAAVCAAFCVIASILCGNAIRLGVLIPVLMMGMLAICPVFVNLKFLGWVQLLFPPTYYLNAIQNPVWLWYMVIYAVAVMGLSWLVWYMFRRKQV